MSPRPPPKTRKKAATLFKKGTPKPPNAGRKKGQPNRTTTLLKDAILIAATMLGRDGKGRDGLVGYLMQLATKEKAVYARLLEKVLPLQVRVDDERKPLYTAAEAVERLRERGLPVPPSLLSFATPIEQALVVAGALNDEHCDGDTDRYDNRLFGDEDYEDELGGEDEE